MTSELNRPIESFSGIQTHAPLAYVEALGMSGHKKERGARGRQARGERAPLSSRVSLSRAGSFFYPNTSKRLLHRLMPN